MESYECNIEMTGFPLLVEKRDLGTRLGMDLDFLSSRIIYAWLKFFVDINNGCLAFTNKGRKSTALDLEGESPDS